MPQVNILFHSVTGHTYGLAEALGEGVRQISGCQVRLLRMPEPTGQPITMVGIEKGRYEFSHIPEAKVEDLVACDGLAIGTAVYWGNMSYATKHFLDSAAKLWHFPSGGKTLIALEVGAGLATIQPYSVCGRSLAPSE
jgi:NAD(P)H dehydrogenase (quinone)